jgi:glutamate-ammonia-ligase adenylyltransferase
LTIADAKLLQTDLAEASIESALAIANDELLHRSGLRADSLSVLGLGKLGGRGMDYGSDLDLVLVYRDADVDQEISAAELHSRAVELFVSALSGVTRDGSLYRVDLRLRPYGKNGASSNPQTAFISYFSDTADLWELLAFVKLRGVAGPIADDVEAKVREIIHRRALESGPGELRSETLRIRYLLEREKAGKRKEADIKYGPGGMLDVYFATRYLQLRDNVPDTAADRSTLATLARLRGQDCLTSADHEAFSTGYDFLSKLDHNIRLVSGRSARLPSDEKAMALIAERMKLPNPSSLQQHLAIHRLEIRAAFEQVLRVM